jgi:TRAP-type C4-dicarboxylate transport system substrate-binding protein
MKARWHPLLAIAGALALATLGTPMVFAQPGGGEESAVTLSLAVWDQPGRQAEQAALDLVALAPDLSGGIITVAEPNWGMSDAADLVQSGQVDLAILATREWSPFGVKSLDALEAPFLITENALAQAVATSTVADAAMAGLTDLGVTGLVMWPEDLRHLFAFEPFGRAFTTSEDFAGSTILAIAGRPGRELITNLGGLLYEEIETDTQTGDRVLDSLSGVLDGMVTGLWGAGLATDQIDGALVAGDVVLYPKFQVLAANTETLAQLTDTQRAALDDIVVEVHRRALNRHFSEAELAAGICERGGTVVEAGHAAIAELRAAARPLTEAMASDLVMGDVMTRIRALADQTPHGDGAGTCAPISRAATESATLEPSVSEEELAGFTGSELLPDGIYRAHLVAAELEAAGADRNYAAINDGMWTLAIEGDGWEAMHDRNSEECSGTQEIVDGNIRLKTVVSRGLRHGLRRPLEPRRGGPIPAARESRMESHARRVRK